ncbi:MAG TPA: class I SAM-dependent methyltransferase [Blastocatellia bacterium]|nr:class I SAM-dependent methyltransferase [Blastocatellia bacterium]
MLVQDKLDLLDTAFNKEPIRSFAELGCTWGVEGGYGFYLLDRYELARAVMVDLSFTDGMTERARAYPQLSLIQGRFGEPAVARASGQVDAAILFDVLLHQVAPDWDQVLALWADKVRYMLIYNQQWTGPGTIRLIELGEETYFQNVPAGAREAYGDLFKMLDEPIPARPERIYRDSLGIWKWGITDGDLIRSMNRLGFTLDYYKNCGPAFGLPNFQNHAFLFAK